MIVKLNNKQWQYVRQRLGLTRRETQVAECINMGFRDVDISHELNVTKGTIKAFMRNIYRKVGINHRLQLLLTISQILEEIK